MSQSARCVLLDQSALEPLLKPAGLVTIWTCGEASRARGSSACGHSRSSGTSTELGSTSQRSGRSLHWFSTQLHARSSRAKQASLQSGSTPGGPRTAWRGSEAAGSFFQACRTQCDRCDEMDNILISVFRMCLCTGYARQHRVWATVSPPRRHRN